ncbi:MAG: SPOR domain-containing protein [Bryobacteraceae bacterium]
MPTDCATDMALPDSQSYDSQIEAELRASDGASKSLKGLFFGFAASVTIGLALASWYVGVRIVSADEVAPAARVPVSAAPAPPTQAPAVQAAAPSTALEDSMAEAYWYSVPPTELYLQVDGLGPKQDASFVRSLQAKGLPARIQAQASDSARILIGPFSSHTEMERAQRKLQSSGILVIEAMN